MIEYVTVGKASGPQEELEKFLEAIGRMPDEIPGIVYLSVGIIKKDNAKQGFNFGAVIRFEDSAAKEGYRFHPYHKGVKDKYRYLVDDLIHVEYPV